MEEEYADQLSALLDKVKAAVDPAQYQSFLQDAEEIIADRIDDADAEEVE